MRAMVIRFGIVLAAGLASSGCAEFGRTGSRPATPPPKVSIRFCLASREASEGFEPVQDERGETLYVATTALLTEADVKSATLMESRKRTIILLEFKPLAADRLDRETANHIGKRLAIFVDDQLVVSPTINSRISRGKAAIDGDFTKERAAEIVRVLNSSSAPPTSKPQP
jgi:preprotein translocase subunit SecD